MSQEWMIDVLTDLRVFAQKNGLMGLAEQLDDSILVAATEMKTVSQKPNKVVRDAQQVRNLYRTSESGDVV